MIEHKKNKLKIQIDLTTLRGTDGFCRVGRDRNGRWWLVAPDGQPWFHRGVCSVHYDGQDQEPPREQKEAGVSLDLNTPEKVIAWLRTFGINALGSWTNPSFFDKGMPYAILIHTRRVYQQGTLEGPGLKMIDIFDPQFRRAYDTACAEIAAQHANSLDLIGYFTDNEPGWAQAWREHVWGGTANVDRKKAAPTLLQLCLVQHPERAACSAAWNFVLHRHENSMSALAKAWGADFADEAELRRLDSEGLVLDSAGYSADHEAFTAYYAREYFSFVGQTIRRHDPNHLILGCRYGGNPGPVVLKAQRDTFDAGDCNILSMNSYRADFGQRIAAYADVTGMPILNGEFAWASDYFRWPRADGADCDLSISERVRQRGISALESGIAHPSLVGYTWFKFRHKFTDASAPHYGLVNQANVENLYNTRLLGEINERADDLACGAKNARVADLGPICDPVLMRQ